MAQGHVLVHCVRPVHSPSGFVEPGESLEDAVRREALEETGVHVEQVAYHSSQPWPFPANLIFGAFGLAKKSRADIRLDLDAELEDAFFAPRADVLAAVAAAEQGKRPHGDDAPSRNGQNYLYVQLLMQRAAAVGHRPRPPRRLGARPGTGAGQNVGGVDLQFGAVRRRLPSRRTMLSSAAVLSRSAWKGRSRMASGGLGGRSTGCVARVGRAGAHAKEPPY